MKHQPLHETRLFPPDDPKRLEALRMIVSGDARPNDTIDRRVADLLKLVETRGLAIDLVCGTVRNNRLLCACMCVETPGQTALLYAPPGPLKPHELEALPPTLQTLQQHAWRRELAFVQVLLAPGDSALEDALSDARFELLAELRYLDRASDAPPDLSAVRNDLLLETYRPDTHDLFLRALELSYVQSLDCPRLTGLRETEQALATHMATGTLDPTLWCVARKERDPLGVLLLSKVLGRSALEVVYMGVSPAARGHGVGDALLAHAVQQCARENASTLTLAVDGSNTPALSLYARWGFAETTRRRAWIAVNPEVESR